MLTENFLFFNIGTVTIGVSFDDFALVRLCLSLVTAPLFSPFSPVCPMLSFTILLYVNFYKDTGNEQNFIIKKYYRLFNLYKTILVNYLFQRTGLNINDHSGFLLFVFHDSSAVHLI